MSAHKKEPGLFERQCGFQGLVTPEGDTSIWSTEMGLLLRDLLLGHKQKEGTVAHIRASA